MLLKTTDLESRVKFQCISFWVFSRQICILFYGFKIMLYIVLYPAFVLTIISTFSCHQNLSAVFLIAALIIFMNYIYLSFP